VVRSYIFNLLDSISTVHIELTAKLINLKIKNEVLMQTPEKLVLACAGIFNVAGGFMGIILLGFLGSCNGFPNSEALFRLFFGGVAVTLGSGYFLSALGRADARTFLMYGGTIKYWAFLISMYVYLAKWLPSDRQLLWLSYSNWVLYVAGLGNLLFAILFTIVLWRILKRGEGKSLNSS
jgi:hypothetical protein